MTDAAVPVTQSAVEQFTERYLQHLGATIEKNSDRWTIRIPDTADTNLSLGEQELLIGQQETEIEDAPDALHPESSFFQTLVADAADRSPVGKVVINGEQSDVNIPQWIAEGGVEVVSANFTPYYDRTALALLHDVGIETVSEYQTSVLRAATIDTRTQDQLPGLTETFLEMTSIENTPSEDGVPQIDSTRAAELVDLVSSRVKERLQPKIDEIHKEASRAADAEVEEFRQLQQQRIEELEEDVSRLSRRIRELNDAIETGSDGGERVELLKQRKELKAELKNAEREVEDIRNRREQGFPEKQREIRNRHALDVTISPLSVTEIEYESGEAVFDLQDGSYTDSITVGYGSGAGVAEDVHCDSCDHPFTNQRPLESITGGRYCMKCADGNSQQ